MVFALTVLANLAQVGRADPYTFTTINVPSADNSTQVTGINNAGQIIGYYSDARQFHGFLDDGGRFTTTDPPGSVGTQPLGISDAGQIVGMLFPTITASIQRGFLYDQGTFTTINAPVASPSNVGSVLATGINSAGQIVGYFNNFQAFLDDHGTFTLINVPGTIGLQPTAINDAGQIVGTYFSSAGPQNISPSPQGFLYEHGTFTTIDVPGGTGTHATGINNAGQIVGYSAISGRFQGFVDDHGSFTIIDLRGAALTELFGINDAGQIVGISTDSSRRLSSFVANPVAVPEPPSLPLLLAGLAGIVILRWRFAGRRSA
jgi:probable HAF family extracellular repeat protein